MEVITILLQNVFWIKYKVQVKHLAQYKAYNTLLVMVMVTFIRCGRDDMGIMVVVMTGLPVVTMLCTLLDGRV